MKSSNARSRRFPDLVIFGLGHIGASLAAALSPRGWKVWGWDKDPVALRFCRKEGWLYHVARDELRVESTNPICVVALPERAVRDSEFVRMLTHLPPGTLVTDVFSSKGQATRELGALCKKHGLRHAWSHPLAGHEGHGAASANPAIFDGAKVFVDSMTPAATRAELAGFWKAVGCDVEPLSARAHQKRMAAGSHLMHVLAYAAMHALGDSRNASPSVLGVTRVAKSEPEAWATILSSNKTEVTAAIAKFERELAKLTQLLKKGDEAALRRYLLAAQKLRLRLEGQS